MDPSCPLGESSRACEILLCRHQRCIHDAAQSECSPRQAQPPRFPSLSRENLKMVAGPLLGPRPGQTGSIPGSEYTGPTTGSTWRGTWVSCSPSRGCYAHRVQCCKGSSSLAVLHAADALTRSCSRRKSSASWQHDQSAWSAWHRLHQKHIHMGVARQACCCKMHSSGQHAVLTRLVRLRHGRGVSTTETETPAFAFERHV